MTISKRPQPMACKVLQPTRGQKERTKDCPSEKNRVKKQLDSFLSSQTSVYNFKVSCSYRIYLCGLHHRGFIGLSSFFFYSNRSVDRWVEARVKDREQTIYRRAGLGAIQSSLAWNTMRSERIEERWQAAPCSTYLFTGSLNMWLSRMIDRQLCYTRLLLYTANIVKLLHSSHISTLRLTQHNSPRRSLSKRPHQYRKSSK